MQNHESILPNFMLQRHITKEKSKAHHSSFQTRHTDNKFVTPRNSWLKLFSLHATLITDHHN